MIKIDDYFIRHEYPALIPELDSERKLLERYVKKNSPTGDEPKFIQVLGGSKENGNFYYLAEYGNGKTLEFFSKDLTSRRSK